MILISKLRLLLIVVAIYALLLGCGGSGGGVYEVTEAPLIKPVLLSSPLIVEGQIILGFPDGRLTAFDAPTITKIENGKKNQLKLTNKSLKNGKYRLVNSW